MQATAQQFLLKEWRTSIQFQPVGDTVQGDRIKAAPPNKSGDA